jgi:DNA-binding beta-propeller fold protein YncE
MLRGTTIALAALALMWCAPANLYASKKKKDTAPVAPAAPVKTPTFENVVFPAAPAVPRLKYLDYFSAQRADVLQEKKVETKKAGWMDRMAGVSADSGKPGVPKARFQLLTPYGVAVDSKGILYVADTKVGAVFMFNTENNDVQFIKHGVDAHFKAIFGLAIDDADNLFVSDGEAHHVLVFDKTHKMVAGFGDAELKNPCGVAIDPENRFIYVADVELDQVLVYDADSYKLLRKIGVTGKKHTSTEIGEFSKPTNLAVDKEGNLYVADTLNDRIEVFDADGNFIRTWGKNGDGPGDFARPKGIAVDSDNHIWVADAMLNRLQVFTSDGNFLLGMGSFGIMPGQFEALTGLTVDKKNNRVYTAEQMLGRVQMYRYYTNSEAKAEIARREEEAKKRAADRDAAKKADEPGKTGMKLPEPPAGAQAAPAAEPGKTGMKLPDLPAGVQAAPAPAK